MLRTVILDPPRANGGRQTLVSRLFSVFAEMRVFVDTGEVLFRTAAEAGALAECVVGLVCFAHYGVLSWIEDVGDGCLWGLEKAVEERRVV
jgi:hypothetical protein